MLFWTEAKSHDAWRNESTAAHMEDSVRKILQMQWVRGKVRVCRAWNCDSFACSFDYLFPKCVFVYSVLQRDFILPLQFASVIRLFSR